jgi:hypothetical protein
MLHFQNFHTNLQNFSYIDHRFLIIPEYHEPFISASPQEISSFFGTQNWNWHSKYYNTTFKTVSSLTSEAILYLAKIKINSTLGKAATEFAS